MDDLYQNAWSETTDPAAAFKDGSTSSWTSPRIASSLHEEADLAAPSWSTGADMSWNEPGSPGISWSQTDADAGWGPSTYEGISFGKSSPEDETVEAEVAEVAERQLDATDGVEEDEEAVEDTVISSHTPNELPSSPFKSPLTSPIPDTIVTHSYETVVVPVAPPSPDGFGSFESGLEEDAVHSPGFAVNAAEADPWGSSAWADSKPQEEEEAAIDEWERAKQEKAKQDRRVPPELLASILTQCEELCREMCPEPPIEPETSEKDAWFNDRRSGMDGVPGLNNLMESFLPPLTLQPPIRFSQSLIVRRMASSVKLTKNLPLTRRSPMSHYLAAKGSTAWEISVKERKEVVEDDVPMGWRIVEKASAAPTEGTKDKKTGGGLFSFWGRRQSQVPAASTAAADSSRSSSSIEQLPKSPVVGELKSESRRPSQESVRSSMTGSAVQLPSPLNESVSPTSAPTLVATPPTMSSYSTAPEPAQERSGTPPAPSAVSRFLNRFSRRSSMGGSPRSSLALSSDDLEFLSDIVPSAADDADEDSTDALERFVNTKRESVTAVPVLPPPLAPPPKAPPTTRSATAASNPASAGSRASSPAGVSNRVSNDLSGLFGSLDPSNGKGLTAPKAYTPPIAGPPADFPMAPPLIPSRPLTPASVPGAVGPSNLAVASTSCSTSSPPSRPQTSTPPLSFGLPPPPSFKPIIPSTIKPKPKLSSPFPLPPQDGSQVESGPMSASSTSSASYETAAESSPPSPTSSLPLSELYPHLVTPNTPPQASSQAFLFDKPANFPAASPVGATPLASAFPLVANVSHLRPPAQSSSIVSPTVTSSLFGDDDFSDFQSPVDQMSPPVPSPIAKSPRTLAAAKAASAAIRGSPVQPSKASTLSPFALPPPPGSSSSRSEPPASQINLASFDDDDFADFQESPMSATSMQTSITSATFGASASDKSLLTPKNSMSFSSFNDSFESLGTPSPPRPPAKPVTTMQPPPLQRPAPQPQTLQPPPLQPPPSQPARLPPPSQPPRLQPPPLQPPPLQPHQSQPPALRPPPSQRAATQPPPPPASTSMPTIPSSSSGSSLLARRESKKRSHAADHLHTLSLVEAAAARSGKQWPAPPSPLPAAIPGPAGGATQGSLFNIMDDDDGSGAAAAPALPPSFSSPAMLNLVRPASGMGMGNGTSQGFQPLMGMGFMSSSSTTGSNGTTANPLLPGWDSSSSIAQWTSTPPIAPNAFGAPAKKSTTGSGLSAQDLSFFEGF